MSLPSPQARPSRLTGLAIVLCLVALLALPAGSAATGATPAATPDPAPWRWPLGPDPVVAHGFEAPATRYSAGHRGIDIVARAGAAVSSPAGGTVHFSGVVGGRPVLSLDHPGGVLSSFEPVDSDLAAGDRVALGDPLGFVSGPSASHCTGCLHFGVRVDGEYVSPLRFLGGIGPAVLIPTRGFG